MPLDAPYFREAEARLAQLSPPLLDAFRDARAVLPAALTDDQQRLWVEEGLALAAHSPRPPPVLEGIPARAADLAAACLEAAPGALHSLTQNETAAFIDFAAAISDGAWPEAALYFQRGPDLLRGIEPGQRARYLELSSGV